MSDYEYGITFPWVFIRSLMWVALFILVFGLYYWKVQGFKSQLSKEKEGTKISLDEKDKKIAELTKSLSEKENEKIELIKGKGVFSSKNRALITEIKTLKSKCRDLERNVNQLNMVINEKDLKIEEKKEEMTNMKAVISSLGGLHKRNHGKGGKHKKSS